MKDEGFKSVLKEKTAVAGEMKPDREPACLYANAKQIPEIKGWKLGKTYLLKARMVSKTETTEEDTEESARFEIVGVAGGEGKQPEHGEEEEENDEDSQENDDSYDEYQG